MSRREDAVRVRHMLDAARQAAQFVEGHQRSDLDDDEKLVFALVKCVEIVGEASTQLDEETRSRYPGVPWQAIRGMRNRLIHAYFDIDVDVLWQTVTRSLPELIEELERHGGSG